MLGGLGISEAKQKNAEGSEDPISNLGKHQEGEQMKNPEGEEETMDPPREQSSEVEVKTPSPPTEQKPETEIETLGTPKEQNPVGTPRESTKQIGEPITLVTPL